MTFRCFDFNRKRIFKQYLRAMGDFNEITRITQQENNEKWRKEKEEEIKKIHKMKLLLSIVKSANAKNMNVDDPNSLNKKLQILAVQDGLKLGDSNCLLNLTDCKEIELSYIERKALREYVVKKIKEKCKPLVEIAEAAKQDNPDLYKPEVLQQNIVDLENKRGTLQKKLVEVKNQKCELLKECVELRTGPSTSNQLQVLLTNSKLNQAKAEVLQAVMVNEFIARTEHTEKAVKEVAENIEALLDNE